jgi:2-desacetyl-2-hydroxyethyl bacteriochlorophyllide A dehydrogenase
VIVQEGRERMKAVICKKPGELAVAERQIPVRKSDEILLKVLRVGLCGTDFHIFAGNQPFLSYPRVMGHELAAEVVETGPDAPVAVGDIVTVNPYLDCGNCIACRNGKPNCCTSITVLGVHVDGGLCDYICVPEQAVILVNGLSADQAAMVEFLSVGAHAVRRGMVTEGDRILVVGAGPIGIAAALFARMRGAAVTIIERDAARLTYARNRFGFASSFVVNDAIDDAMAQLTDGEFFDCVFDATGNVHAIRKGLDYVAHGGRYVLISVVKEDISFPDPEFHKREATLIGSRNATHEDFAHVIDCIRRGAIDTLALNTQQIPAQDLVAAFPKLLADQASVLKAIVSF